MFEHACREATHGRFGLDVEVSKHFIAAPPADQADDIGINVGAQRAIAPAARRERAETSEARKPRVGPR